MKKTIKKFSPQEWRRILKNVLVCALVLAAVAASYGYYLVEKMGEEYKQAQMVILQNEVPNVPFQAEDDTELAITGTVQTEPEVLLSADAAVNAPKEASVGNISSEEAEVQAESEPKVQDNLQVISYEAVGEVAAVTAQPCEAAEVYAYGYGYDPVYKDIRFHNHALFQAQDNFAVLAVADGVVEKCTQNAEGFEVTLKHEWGLSVYENLEQCTLSVGRQVKSGEKIGESTILRYSLWQEK